MSILDSSVANGADTGTAPNASASILAKDTEFCLAYGVNSNTAVAAFGAPWTDLPLNLNATGKFGSQRKSGAGNVSIGYAVPGTQAWAALVATFGSSAIPVLVNRGNNNQAVPFTSAGMVFTAGRSLIFTIEFISNASNAIPITVTDSAGNVWVKIADAIGTRNGPNGQLAQATMFYCQNCIGGGAVTLSVGGNSGVLSGVWSVWEATNLIDVISGGAGGLLSLGVGN